MAAAPETRYARSGTIDIAYQRFGTGDVTFVGVPPVVSNIDVMWEEPRCARFLERLGSFCDVVHFDKRGSGLSDRNTDIPGLEDRAADFTAVMDAAGIDRAVLAGVSEGGLMAAFFAASHPERVDALILTDSFARMTRAPGYEFALERNAFDAFIEAWAAHWGTPETLTLPVFCPSMAGDADFLAWLNRYERATVSPRALVDTMRLNAQLDLRDTAAMIAVPTLVMHRRDDLAADVRHGRWLAEHIPGARYVELEGADHFPWIGDADAVLDEMEEFLTGRRAPRSTDRMLATVLFTDIVDSTARAAALGDQRWRELLDTHDRLVLEHVERHAGRVVKSTGDGALATFDGPARAIRCALALTASLTQVGIEIRAGLHTGEIEVRGDDVGGIAVHIAARVEAAANPGEVLASRTVKDLVAGSELRFEDRGAHQLKGVPDDWHLYAASL